MTFDQLDGEMRIFEYSRRPMRTARYAYRRPD